MYITKIILNYYVSCKLLTRNVRKAQRGATEAFGASVVVARDTH